MEKIISLEGLNRLGIRILNKVTSNLSTAELEEKSPDAKRAEILENPGLFSRQVSTYSLYDIGERSPQIHIYPSDIFEN